MSGSPRRLRESERGASEVAGAALLIGLVAVATLATLVIGGSAIDGIQSESDGEQASTILQEMDSRFSSISSSGDAQEMSIDLGETNPDDFQVRNDGFVNVTVNKRTSCSAGLNMSSLYYEDNGATVGYQAGGVWRSGSTNGSSMLTSPSVTYNSGTIDVEVVNLTGTVDQGQNYARYLEARSEARSTKLSNDVLTGDCIRPDNVTLHVKSHYYVAWENYLDREFGGNVEAFDSNQTVRVFLGQDDLPERVDDNKNNVVNLSAGYSDPEIDSDSIKVDKDADEENVYSVSVTPLNTNNLNIGRVTDIDGATNVTRSPLDVMFVLDESGSMGSTDGDHTDRAEEAQTAAKGFVAELNESMDRGGVVAYEDEASYEITRDGDGQYITGDFAELNSTIEETGRSGGTESQNGIRYANNVFELRSDETRDKVMVLLTDGMNNDCQSGDDTTNDDPFDCGPPEDDDSDTDNRLSAERADEAAANGVTIYTVGYGDDADIDETFLEEIANRTDGTYYQATNSDELDSVFDAIVEEVTRTKHIALSPVSGNYSSGTGKVYGPHAAGSTERVAQINVNGHDFANINDPTAAGRFAYSFAVTDGETIDISAYDFDCEEWAGTGRTLTHSGDIYNVIRCTEIVKDDSHPPNRIITNGGNIEDIITEDVAWWQKRGEGINETLNGHPDITVSTDDSDLGHLELKSNQALVSWNLPDGADSKNRLLMLYEIGIAESDAEATGVINLEHTSVRIEE